MPDCYQPYDSKKIINKNFNREKFNLPESGFIFCCFNGVYKINPIIFDCWMRILNKTNNTNFCFLESNNFCKQNLINEVKIYDMFLTGDVYGFVLSEAVLTVNSEVIEWEKIDSCWGFYGSNFANEKV